MVEFLSDIFRFVSANAGSWLAKSESQAPVEDYEVLANTTYNQRTPDGLRAVIVKTQERVAQGLINLESPELTRLFVRQSPKTAAANLCNTVARFMNTQPEGDFGKFYTDGVRRDCYKWTGKFAHIIDAKTLTERVITEHFTAHWSVSKSMQTLDDAQPKTAIIRNRRNTHTYLVFNRAGEYICADTYHNNWTGKSLTERLGNKSPRWVYWYE